MKIPTHLKHVPLVKLENYNEIDGPYSKNSDAKGLSVGYAQWNGAGGTDISAKVWRYTGEKWSRQSEELPIHRVLDLATLVCNTIQYATNDHQLPSARDFNISISNDAEADNLVRIMEKQFSDNKEVLDKSLDRLVDALKKLGKI